MKELDFEVVRSPEGTLCPWCGEPVEVDVEALGPAREVLVQDCDVCCRPLLVTVFREDGENTITLERENG